MNNLAYKFMDKNNLPGMSIAVLKDNKIVIYNYGYANEAKKIKVTNNTIYPIASFTKTFTATLAAIASVEGKLNLDDPFTKYFPALKNHSNLNKIPFCENGSLFYMENMK